MVVRRRRKHVKLRGRRTHGHGNTKNRRGSGSRGGVGRAGSHKHQFSRYYLTYGAKITLKAKKTQKGINLGDLEKIIPKLLVEKKVEKRDGAILIEGKNFSYSKILGKGKINEKLELKGIKVSENARKKIEAAGGKIA